MCDLSGAVRGNRAGEHCALYRGVHMSNGSNRVQFRIQTAGLVAGLSVAASALAGPLSFTNEALPRGFNFRVGFNYHQVGAGNMLADLDNDGDLDILIAGGLGGVFGLFENDGSGNFTERTLGSGLNPFVNASGLSAADYGQRRRPGHPCPGLVRTQPTLSKRWRADIYRCCCGSRGEPQCTVDGGGMGRLQPGRVA